MKAAELLAVLEGVPDEALPYKSLPSAFRMLLASMDDDGVGHEVDAAVGAMLAWLLDESEDGDDPHGMPAVIDAIQDHYYHHTPLVVALAAACKQVKP